MPRPLARPIARAFAARTPGTASRARQLHSTPAAPANPLPIVATGPPPAPPQPATDEASERAARRRAHAELLRQNQGGAKGSSTREAMRRRFWKEVSVRQAPEGHYTVHLDARAVRTPHAKSPLHIPSSKPHVAAAVALEWDLLVSAQQALKTHLVPLTSLAARALDIEAQDKAAGGAGTARKEIATLLLRYLDTDTLLCWEPAPDEKGEADEARSKLAAAFAGGTAGHVPGEPGDSLNAAQKRAAAPITDYLCERVWPGADLQPALQGGSILPIQQSAETRRVVAGWLDHLPAWELAGLERAALATKSLCVAARLVAEWGESVGAKEGKQEQRFGVEQAADACTVEVRWQTQQWGEVEDSHDVEREDLLRQLGSAVLVVSGSSR